MNYLFFRLLPKNVVSRLAGKATDVKAPTPVLKSLIQMYCRFYNINTREIKKPLSAFRSFDEFFTRELKEGARPLDDDENSVVSPVDGTISEFGPIEDGFLVQTKGVLYSLVDLVGKRTARKFDHGYYITLYLSPADYHRIHTPAAGAVNRYSYFSGNLWPVNNTGVNYVSGLFSLNERIATLLETENNGSISIIKVGATVVGKISVDYDELQTNSHHKTALDVPVVPSRRYEKGSEVGRFHLGSTVILLFQKDQIDPVSLFKNKKIRMGQIIAKFK